MTTLNVRQVQAMAAEDNCNAKKRFCFTHELQVVLVYCIGLDEAQIAKNRELENKFESVLAIFCTSHQFIYVHEKCVSFV